MNTNKNYYEMLGVSSTVEPEALKAVYRALAKKYHPDTTSSTSTSEIFRDIQEAYEVLSDAELRSNYDRERLQNEDIEEELDDDPLPNERREDVSESVDEEDALKKSLTKRPLMWMIIAVVAAGLVVMRGTVVGLWPGANGAFYDLIGMHVDIPGEGLKIMTAAPVRETRNGKDAVVIRGTITNISDTDRPVPVIQINIFDGNDAPVQTESMSPEKSLLKPGEKFDFSAVIIDLVLAARRLDVTFGELE